RPWPRRLPGSLRGALPAADGQDAGDRDQDYYPGGQEQGGAGGRAAGGQGPDQVGGGGDRVHPGDRLHPAGQERDRRERRTDEAEHDRREVHDPLGGLGVVDGEREPGGGDADAQAERDRDRDDADGAGQAGADREAEPERGDQQQRGLGGEDDGVADQPADQHRRPGHRQ